MKFGCLDSFEGSLTLARYRALPLRCPITVPALPAVQPLPSAIFIQSVAGIRFERGA